MGVAPERQRKEDYERWRKMRNAREALTPPKLSKFCKNLKYFPYNEDEEEHW